MADKQQTDPPETDPKEPQEPDQEAFWTKLREETAKVVDARLAERDRKRAENGKRRSDTKRATVPGMIADVMFGKDK